MRDVQTFVDSPQDKDVMVKEVFNKEMFEQLCEAMTLAGWSGVPETKARWQQDLSDRRIISGFLKDKTIGDKRLASMPDRVTNTVRTTQGLECRPTVINCYNGNLDSQDKWWTQWKTWMFDTDLPLKDKQGKTTGKKPIELLSIIKASKYPALTEEEEKISLPLQTLCQAIFDAIMVHILNSVAQDKWQPLKAELQRALVQDKTKATLDILSGRPEYAGADVICLQEVASHLKGDVDKSVLAENFHMVLPNNYDKHRDQNSALLLRRSRFKLESIQEVTDAVLQRVEGKIKPDKGDLLAVTVQDTHDQKWLLASFHGDTNGLATCPVLSAVHATQQKEIPEARLVFGLDANTYERESKGKTQGMAGFVERYVSLGLSSCWGDKPDPTKHTTCNARTYLQPQLNKAVRIDQRFTSKESDCNPKDFILFPADLYAVRAGSSIRDNTGKATYTENMVFPTLLFPSDHAIISTEIVPKL
eukprot:gb/GEZN01002647.1/.p1 GENE.gb/GEZN01002647.1/~~gb/GEZN01002647.1/.p1  ORF type:complete len:475 (+),score=72.79 gb/GEZN01002647.1/:325-1749(+)